MPVQKHATAVAQGSRARRQNHSCDQCRKSKRACDALCLDLTRRATLSNIDRQRSPCSYCARTKKRCTMEWARSHAQSALKLSYEQPQYENLSQDLLFPWNFDELPVETESGIRDNQFEPHPTQELMAWELANVDLSGPFLDYDSMPPSSNISQNEVPREEMQADMRDALTSARSLTDSLPFDFSSASDIST